MNIALDMMGGDFAPLEAVKGLNKYLQLASPAGSGANVLCVGDEVLVKPLLDEFNLSFVPLVHAPEVIGYNEHPTRALKEKPRSSIAIGFHLLATGKADAFIS